MFTYATCSSIRGRVRSIVRHIIRSGLRSGLRSSVRISIHSSDRHIILGSTEGRVTGVELTLLLICAGVSVQKIAEVSSDADIFELAPCGID